MKLKIAGISEAGKFRKSNDDAYLIDEALGLTVVCDGSTSPFGQEASTLACQTVRQFVAKNFASIEKLLTSDRQTERAKALKFLESAVQLACSAVYKLAQDDPRKSGIYTTLDVILAAQGQVLIGHVGDGRVYLLRGGNLRKITTDHTYYTEMVKDQALTPEEAMKRPYSQILTRNLGQSPYVGVDVIQFEAVAEDFFLICTDGVSDHLPMNTTLTADNAAKPDLAAFAKSLLATSEAQGSKDNLTAVVLRVEKGTESELKRPAQKTNEKFEMVRSLQMFQYMTYNEVMKILSIVNLLELKPDAVVVEEGKKSDEMYIVLRGKVTISVANEFIAEGGRGEVIGEMGLFDNIARSATVKAKETTELMSLGRKDLFKLMREDRELAVKFCWGVIQELSQRIRARSDQLAVLQHAQKSTASLEVPFFGEEI